LNLSTIPTLTVQNSAMRFDTGRLVNPQVGRAGREAIAFTVMRAPDANDEPTLVLSNLLVEGQAFPGVEYQVVISGTAIANNDQEVYHAHHGHGNAHGAVLRHMSRGVFTSLPYHGTVVTNASGGVWDHAPDLGAPGQGAPGRELRVHEGMPAVAGVDVPFFWEIVGPNRVGMISLRVFAEYFLGTTPVWNHPSGTISGLHANGSEVSFSFTNGATNVNLRVDGVDSTVDIATFVDFLSGPAGTVSPSVINDRAYLPLRFVAEAFGLTVEQVGNVVIIR